MLKPANYIAFLLSFTLQPVLYTMFLLLGYYKQI